jgi:hypothetical protein
MAASGNPGYNVLRSEEDFMKRSPRPRKTANLSESIHQQLNMYAIAAGAAGVSLLALAQPAEAKIVYTPAHIKIGSGGVGNYYLDINHDGVADFLISAGSSCDPDRCLYSFDVETTTPGKGGIAFQGSFGRPLAQALHQGAVIGVKRGFQPLAGMVSATYFSTGKQNITGHWINVTNRYLGLKFQVKGKTHYGWARLNVKVHKHPFSISATLTGYAYETIPNKLIIAGKTKGADEWDEEDFGPDASMTAPIPYKPQPASLGMLALGAQGVPLWRRKETVVATE